MGGSLSGVGGRGYCTPLPAIVGAEESPLQLGFIWSGLRLGMAF
jgi:hypothetical protein